MRIASRIALVLIAVAAIWPSVILGSILSPLSGYADVAGSRADINGSDQETLRQDYNLIFATKLSQMLDVRAAYRYYEFDQDIDLQLGAYSKETQPSAEVRWRHPLYVWSVSGVRREVTRATTPGSIVMEDFRTNFKTRGNRYPVLELLYEQRKTYNDEFQELNDIRNKRAAATLTQHTDQHMFQYGYDYTDADNVVSNVTTRRERQILRWTGVGSATADGRVQLAGNYTFNYTTSKNRVVDGGLILEFLPAVAGLHILDQDPTLSTLEPRAGLIDGNTSAPVVPNIDIGGTGNDHNVGLDLGSPRDVSSLYIHTDRPSGDAVTWAVYVSDDNLTWQLVDASPQQVFNAALNRYELAFSTVVGRYVKAVNSGLNEVALVLVTEVSALRAISQTNEDRNIAASHLLDGRIGYRINDLWNMSLDASFLYDEIPGRQRDRDRESLGCRLGYRPSHTVSHGFRWELARQADEASETTVVNNSLGYALTLNPSDALHGSASVSDYLSWWSGDRAQHNITGALEGSATLLPDLVVTVGTTAALANDDLTDRNLRTWTTRTAVDAALTRSLDIVCDASYQQTVNVDTDAMRVRRYGSIGLDWHVTSTIYARGAARFNRDIRDAFTYDLLLSWNLLPSLRLSLQHYELGEDVTTTTLRRSANVNWQLSNRSNMYLRFAEVDLSGGGGRRTETMQLGLRTSF